MTLEIRQMVIRSEVGAPRNGAAGQPASAPSGEQRGAASCCDEDEAASDRHRAERAQLPQLRLQLARLRER